MYFVGIGYLRRKILAVLVCHAIHSNIGSTRWSHQDIQLQRAMFYGWQRAVLVFAPVAGRLQCCQPFDSSFCRWGFCLCFWFATARILVYARKLHWNEFSFKSLPSTKATTAPWICSIACLSCDKLAAGPSPDKMYQKHVYSCLQFMEMYMYVYS